MEESSRHLFLIKQIHDLSRKKSFRLTLHAEQERDADSITFEEINAVLLYDTIEILEDYKEDPRGASFLMLGFTQENAPLHIVGALHEEMLIVITLYRPDPKHWENFRKRKEIK